MTRALPERSSLDAVLLDAGGVLVNPDWTRVAAVLAAHDVDVRPEALERAEPGVKKQLDRPHIIQATDDESRAASYFSLIVERAGFPAPVPEAAWEGLRAEHARRSLWRAVLPGVPEALGRLRASGLRLAVVSNANGLVPLLFADLGLAPYFDVLLDSFLEKLEKPDPRLFARALDRLETLPARTLHVGDLYHVDVVGARAAGVAAALIDVDGLYVDADCPRFASLPALTAALLG
jgi:putative hydrolase of the HAD superfamily